MLSDYGVAFPVQLPFPPPLENLMYSEAVDIMAMNGIAIRIDEELYSILEEEEYETG